jgi:hypothetical protein
MCLGLYELLFIVLVLLIITIVSYLIFRDVRRRGISVSLFHIRFIKPQKDSKEYRKNWARLIRKIYEVDPLTCPKCQGTMKVVIFIEDKDVIEKILKHLGIWLVKKKPSARTNAPSAPICLDYSDSQIPPSEDHLYKDPDYSIEPYTSSFQRRPWGSAAVPVALNK